MESSSLEIPVAETPVHTNYLEFYNKIAATEQDDESLNQAVSFFLQVKNTSPDWRQVMVSPLRSAQYCANRIKDPALREPRLAEIALRECYEKMWHAAVQGYRLDTAIREFTEFANTLTIPEIRNQLFIQGATLFLSTVAGKPESFKGEFPIPMQPKEAFDWLSSHVSLFDITGVREDHLELFIETMLKSCNLVGYSNRSIFGVALDAILLSSDPNTQFNKLAQLAGYCCAQELPAEEALVREIQENLGNFQNSIKMEKSLRQAFYLHRPIDSALGTARERLGDWRPPFPHLNAAIFLFAKMGTLSELEAVICSEEAVIPKVGFLPEEAALFTDYYSQLKMYLAYLAELKDIGLDRFAKQVGKSTSFALRAYSHYKIATHSICSRG